MSVALMALAFKAPLPSTKKLVLLALCDSANDQGECYPSVTTLAEKCSLSERAVQGAIKELENDGFVQREFRTGRATVYLVKPDATPRTTCTPASDAPPQQMHPRTTCTTPPQQVHPTPARRAPITIKEPSKNQKKPAPETVAVSELVAAGFDEHTALEFIAHKRRVKAPLTARAWRDHLAESSKAGWTPMQAAEKVMAKSWKGFEARYVANERPPVASPGIDV